MLWRHINSIYQDSPALSVGGPDMPIEVHASINLVDNSGAGEEVHLSSPRHDGLRRATTSIERGRCAQGDSPPIQAAAGDDNLKSRKAELTQQRHRRRKLRLRNCLIKVHTLINYPERVPRRDKVTLQTTTITTRPRRGCDCRYSINLN